MPEEIKPHIPHQTTKYPITAAIIQAFKIIVKQSMKQNGGSFGEIDISL
jgi:hypothetical protein